jgi:protein TonB
VEQVAVVQNVVSRQVPGDKGAGTSMEGTATAAGRAAGRNPEVQATAGEGDATVAEKSKHRYLREHFAYIRDLITKRLVYPYQARKMGWGGKVTVSFVVNEDGSVHEIKVVESSGVPLLDKSAMETVRIVAPFPKPPLRAEIVIPVMFKLM